MKQIEKETLEKRIQRKTKADKIVRSLLFALCFFSSILIFIVIFFIVLKGIKPFISTYTVSGEETRVNLVNFLFGNEWHTLEKGYGIGYIILNTIYIALLTLLVAGPISILSALVILRMTNKIIGTILNGAIEILGAIPSVIYGMFGLGFINNVVKNLSSLFQFQSAGGMSTLSSVLVLSMMSIPTITVLSISAIKAVDPKLSSASLALGASKSETNFKVILPAAKSGIFAGLIMGLSRSLGEATAVSMVCGNALAGPTFNLFATTRTLTSTMLTGLGEASGLAYDIRFSVGIMLILVILLSNGLLDLMKNKLARVSK